MLPLAGEFQSADAEVVAPAFDEAGTNIHSVVAQPPIVDGVQEHGHIARNELFLQRDGVGCDDDAFAVERAAQHRGDEVGERLSDSRAGLDEQRGAVGECASDGLCHFKLRRARLVPPSQRSAERAG